MKCNKRQIVLSRIGLILFAASNTNFEIAILKYQEGQTSRNVEISSPRRQVAATNLQQSRPPSSMVVQSDFKKVNFPESNKITNLVTKATKTNSMVVRIN